VYVLTSVKVLSIVVVVGTSCMTVTVSEACSVKVMFWVSVLKAMMVCTDVTSCVRVVVASASAGAVTVVDCVNIKVLWESVKVVKHEPDASPR
jgi:hypothetical protein